MPLGTEVSLGPGLIVLDENPVNSPSQINWAKPQFSAHFCCSQTAGWIKMSLGTEVGLGPGHIVLDGDPAPAERALQPPLFVPCLLWLNGRPSQLLLSSCLYCWVSRMRWLGWIKTFVGWVGLGADFCVGLGLVSKSDQCPTLGCRGDVLMKTIPGTRGSTQQPEWRMTWRVMNAGGGDPHRQHLISTASPFLIIFDSSQCWTCQRYRQV